MKIDMFTPPPVAWFGEGAERFGLVLKPWSDAERLDVVDAYSTGKLGDIQRSLNHLVIDWRNVCDLSGVPIPFEGKDEERRKVCNLGRFMGALPIARQAEVVVGLMAFIGLPQKDVDIVARACGQNPAVTVDPTRPSGDATPPSASSDSSASAT